jgi:hypothetical protein
MTAETFAGRLLICFCEIRASLVWFLLLSINLQWAMDPNLVMQLTAQVEVPEIAC